MDNLKKQISNLSLEDFDQLYKYVDLLNLQKIGDKRFKLYVNQTDMDANIKKRLEDATINDISQIIYSQSFDKQATIMFKVDDITQRFKVIWGMDSWTKHGVLWTNHKFQIKSMSDEDLFSASKCSSEFEDHIECTEPDSIFDYIQNQLQVELINDEVEVTVQPFIESMFSIFEQNDSRDILQSIWEDQYS